MTRERRTPDTLGEVLAAQRSERFVGRTAEVELFRSALAGDHCPFAVLHVHGPGGIGKSSLLEVFASQARAHDTHVIRIDGRAVAPTPGSLLDALPSWLRPEAAHPSPDVSERRLVLLIDAYERLSPIDDWVREGLLPSLPSDAVTVLASRHAPTPAWRADAGWRELLRVVSLRNLDPQEARRYLDGCLIDPARHDRIVTATHGHPLALSLAADVVARGGDAPDGTLGPYLVGELLRSLVEAVPDEDHRAVLGVCAIARVTTEELLRHVLERDDVRGPFDWLGGLSFVEVAPDGLVPHDLARDALDADLRWREPAGYARTYRRVAEHVHERLHGLSGRAQQRAISDLKFLFRNVRSVLSPVDWDTWGQYLPEPARPEDRGGVLDLIATVIGRSSADIAARWWQDQPGAWFVVRDERDEIRGVICLLDLTDVMERDRDADPVAKAVWLHAHVDAPPRPGEVVTQTRFVVDRDGIAGPSPTLNAVPIVSLQRQLVTPRLAWDYLVLADAERWEAFFALADAQRVPEVNVMLDGHRFGAFAHDYRRRGVDDLVRLWIERALAQDPTLRLEPEPALLVLSQGEFTAAVRRALRDLHRPDLLARNPLLGTRLLHAAAATGEPPDGATLAQLVRNAIAVLRQHPRDDKLLRALESTYLHPAPTQEAAAARLGLPFSTYRRHLTRGTERVVGWLWDREVYGDEHVPA